MDVNQTVIQKCYENAARAVVLCAVEEYRRVLRKLRRRPCSIYAETLIEEYDEFFCSAYFNALSPLAGEYIINQLKKEYKI